MASEDSKERIKAAEDLHKQAARKRINPFKTPPNDLTTKEMTPPEAKGQAAPDLPVFGPEVEVEPKH
ncbi:MAG: hypothetical protein HPY55_00950 [Firmicutes bacterium]|nr:hypothetical protein [Bacillota bacterium]